MLPDAHSTAMPKGVEKFVNKFVQKAQERKAEKEAKAKEDAAQQSGIEEVVPEASQTEVVAAELPQVVEIEKVVEVVKEEAIEVT